jgi:hypothetical protein
MNSQILDALRALPKAIVPHHDPGKPNGSIVLYEGVLEVERNGVKEICDGALTFRWLPRPALRFRIQLSDFDLEVGPVIIRIPSQDFEASGFISMSNGSEASGVLNGSPRLGKSESVDSLGFQLTNFHSIVGENIQSGTDEHPSSSRRRFTLQHADFVVVVDQVHDYRSRIEQVKSDGGFVVSHAGRVSKPSEGAISIDEADQVLEALHLFFSFARGHWCAATFPHGCRANATIWEQVGAWRVEAWKDVYSWFPKNQPEIGGSAWAGFLSRWMNPDLQPPLKLAIHWYIEANMNSGAVEGAVVRAQAALELLAWEVVVEECGYVDAKDFKRVKTSEKIRMLLRELQIPMAVPDELPALRDAAHRLKVASDPEVFVRLRNGIVHSNKTKRADIAQIEDSARWQALQYGLWCIELVILSLCDYKGVYADRIKHGWVGEVESVPWCL